MKKALIICAGGMSSSLIANKGTKKLQDEGVDVQVDAASVQQGQNKINQDEYDLYLVSPQTKMWFDKLREAAKKHNKPVVSIPPQAYIPIDTSVAQFAKLVKENI